jgi:zinc protease
MLSLTLPNGLRVIVQENHSAKVVAIQVWVRVGSADEHPQEAGLAHVHEHMLFKGTERRGVGEIASAVEGAGGDINAWTSYDQTVYHVTMASRDFDVGLDILADAVQHSTFDREELTRELEVVLEEIRRGNDMPSRVMAENLYKTAYTRHSYSRPVIGYVETVKAFSREMILGFYKKWYRPRNMCLVVVGDVKADDVVAKAEKLFAFDPSEVQLPDRPRPSEPAQAALRTVRATQAIQETHLGLAWHGTPFRHDDTPALDILSILLGSGESSRLFKVVHRDLELVNDVSAYAYTPQDPGLFSVNATIHGPNIEPAFRALLTETMRLRYELPTAAEVEKAKTIVLSEAVYSKETVQGTARKIGFYELVAGGSDYEDVYYTKIRQVTPADVLRVAQRYLRGDGLTVSALLPEEHSAHLEEPAIASMVVEVESQLQKEYQPRSIEVGAEQVAKVKLSNGSTLLVRQDSAVPLISVRAVAKGGTLAETEKVAGVSHLVTSLLTRGTRRYSAEQIAELTDATASGLSGLSGRNSIGLRGDFLKEHWATGFELFLSCLLEPAFEPREIDRERKVQIEDLAGRLDNLSAVCFDQMSGAMWKRHPYRLPTIGTKESVEALGREQVIDAFRRQLRPDRLTIAVVGDFDLPEIVDLFERRIGSIKVLDGLDPQFAAEEPARATSETIRTAKPKEQAHLVIGFPGMTIYDDRRWPIEVLSSVLSGQGGRLFLELRDKQSLCYSVSAFSLEGLAPGYFAVYMGTANEKLEIAEAGIRKELQKVIDAPITDEELERAKRYLIGTHEIGLQRASSRATTMAYAELYGLGYDDYARYAQRIEAVTTAAVREVASQVIRFDRSVRSIVAVGPEESAQRAATGAAARV